MYPILFENEFVLIPAWHSFYLLAAVSAFFMLQSALKIAPAGYRKHSPNLFFVIYFSGYFGARIFSLTVEQGLTPWQSEFWQGLSRLGSMTLYGGVMAGLVASLVFCKVKKLKFVPYLDALAFAAMVAIAIGRIGCFLNGDDYGIPIPNQSEPPPWWAVAFPNHPEHVYRYPTQVIETIVCFILVLIARPWLGRLKPGVLGCILAILYMVHRFFLEFFRGDDRGELISQVLSPAQIISLLGLVLFAAIFMRIVWDGERLVLRRFSEEECKKS